MVAFIFDAWGTLLRPTARPWERFRAVAAELGLLDDEEVALAAVGAAQAWLRELGGLAAAAPAEEDDLWRRYYGLVLDGLGVADSDGSLAGTLARRCLYTSWCEPYPEVPTVLAELAARHPLAVVSNAHPSLAQALERHGLAGHLRAVVTAAQVGVRKPDPRIFAAALAALGAAPTAAVYVDDEEANVEVARRLGMAGLVLDRRNGGGSPGCLRSLAELTERRVL